MQGLSSHLALHDICHLNLIARYYDAMTGRDCDLSAISEQLDIKYKSKLEPSNLFKAVDWLTDDGHHAGG